ncbi:hypothetical protein BKA80DRAFT_115174 [Phyllosticta citrichinensis]
MPESQGALVPDLALRCRLAEVDRRKSHRSRLLHFAQVPSQPQVRFDDAQAEAARHCSQAWLWQCDISASGGHSSEDPLRPLLQYWFARPSLCRLSRSAWFLWWTLRQLRVCTTLRVGPVTVRPPIATWSPTAVSLVSCRACAPGSTRSSTTTFGTSARSTLAKILARTA